MLWRRWVKRIRAIVRRGEVERELNEELDFHLAMEVQKHLDAGLSQDDARRQAMIAFGGVERYKEHVRSARRFDWLNGLSIDFKLGVRMLVKYPGLAVVGCIGLAVSIAIGAASFSVIGVFLNPRVALADGDRVVAIQNVDAASADQNNGRTHLHDLAVWRDEISAIGEFGAYRIIGRNVITGDGRVAGARVAEMTASGFRIARVPPQLGRYLIDADERADAPGVVVIGHAVWQSLFSSNPNVIGKTIQLGRERHTVVGVMPPGFAFPVNNRIWIPFRLDALQYERGEAPSIEVVGRLANGASMGEAQAQLATITQRLAVEHPQTHARIQARVQPLARTFIESPEIMWILRLVQFAVSMILVVIGTNVAVLVYARTITRTGEIAVRTALGATRGRIISQLFAEALVLSLAAAATGLLAARFILAQVEALIVRLGGEQMPFWWDFSLTPAVIVYVAGLALLGAVIVGVIPALKVTGRRVRATLQSMGSGGSGMQLGRTWTILIVAQVAIAAAALPIGLGGFKQAFDFHRNSIGLVTKEYLTTRLVLDRDVGTSQPSDESFRTRFAQLQTELIRRLATEPAVSAVLRSAEAPHNEDDSRIEIEAVTAGVVADSAPPPYIRTGHVDIEFFRALGLRTLAGRTFAAGEFGQETSNAVVVNSAFVEHYLDGAHPLGRRLRYARSGREAGANQPWYEIVGVVANLTDRLSAGEARIYHPLSDDAYPLSVAIRLRGTAPELFADRMRELALAVDPMLRLDNIATLDRMLRDADADEQIAVQVVVALALTAVLLAAAGISALMSVAVARRRREIGILMALGAPQHRVLGQVLARAAQQLALGVAAGIVLLGLFLVADGDVDGGDFLIFAQIAGVMTIIGIVAAIAPARRALRVPPTEALKQE